MRIKIPTLRDRVAFCDPASGRVAVKKTRARSAIVVLTIDWLERIYLIYAWADRVHTDRLIDKIFEVHSWWQPTIFGIDASAMQTPFADAVRREARQKQINLHLHDVSQPTTVQKPFRIRATLQQPIEVGRYFMQEHQIEALHELATHPMNPLCDIPDAISCAVSLLPRRPAMQDSDPEELALAKYLRRTRMPPDAIERHLAEKRYERKQKGASTDVQPSVERQTG